MGRVFGDGHGGHQLIVTAKTDEVLVALKDNRLAHIAKYEDAKKAFFVAAEKLLKKELGKIKSLSVHLSTPTSHEKVYDTAIRMLELHTNSGADTIELDANQVDSLVHDLWDWTDTFNARNASYSR